jgi:hypothetical protein
MTIDPNYTVGFSLARQWGIRVVKDFDHHIWLAAALENPQTTFTVTNAAANFALGSPGSGGGLYNSGGTATGTALANGKLLYRSSAETPQWSDSLFSRKGWRRMQRLQPELLSVRQSERTPVTCVTLAVRLC